MRLLRLAIVLSSLVVSLVTAAPAKDCVGNGPGKFTLRAVYIVSHHNGASYKPVQVMPVQTQPHISWAIMTAATSGGSGKPFDYEILNNGVITAHINNQQFPRGTSVSVVNGSSPAFSVTQFPPPGSTDYCLMKNPLDPGGPQFLAVNGRDDAWALCFNSTSGREDVVYAPASNSRMKECEGVYLQVQVLPMD
uniref:Uncharacterized protein n=1 Tax=Mycena chlorophos TaxID=658473 RepID=A0ABQ0LT20_MYCCL|nr:predicted protein [Mycena chlorophos]